MNQSKFLVFITVYFVVRSAVYFLVIVSLSILDYSKLVNTLISFTFICML